jgi:uncharacterized membrane protein
MFPLFPPPTFAASVYDTLRDFDQAWTLHPILVNFTAALIPISFLCDLLSRVFGRDSLRHAGWWTLFFAALITPFTAAAGWFFWAKDDSGDPNMTIHKWLGTALAALFLALVLWRWHFFKRNGNPTFLYLLLALALVAALIYQGHLGGEKTFSG